MGNANWENNKEDERNLLLDIIRCATRYADEKGLPPDEYSRVFWDYYHKKLSKDFFPDDVTDVTHYFCPSCQLKVSSIYSSKKHFGIRSVLKNNCIPRFCPDCGKKLSDIF